MKKFVLALFILTAHSVITFSQNLESPPGYEFGLILGFNNSGIYSTKSDPTPIIFNDEVVEINSNNQAGFSLGILGHKIINKHFTIGFQPTLSFMSTEISFKLNTQETINNKIESVFLEGPIHLAIHVNKNAKWNPSLILGGKLSYDLAANSRSRQINPSIIQLKSQQYSADIGAGLEIKMKGFCLKPELIYSYGLGNSEDPNSVGPFNQVTEKARRDNISLRFLFYNL